MFTVKPAETKLPELSKMPTSIRSRSSCGNLYRQMDIAARAALPSNEALNRPVTNQPTISVMTCATT